MQIDLRKMSEAEFQEFLNYEGYARSLAKSSGNPLTEMRERVRKELKTLLPQGLETPDHYIYTVYLDEKAVGFFWLAIRTIEKRKTPYAYDIFIDDQERRKGIATKVMYEVESKLKKLGYSELELHVFNHNENSLALCRKLGFKESKRGKHGSYFKRILPFKR